MPRLPPKTLGFYLIHIPKLSWSGSLTQLQQGQPDVTP